MGNQQGIPDDVTAKFATSELKSIEARFNQLAEEGSFRGKSFDRKTMLKHYFPNHPDIAVAFFSAFDSGHNGKVDLLEFATGLAECCRGSNDEKLGFVFRMFDQKGYKKVSPKDISKLLTTGFFTGPGRSDKKFFTTKKEIDNYVQGVCKTAFENFDKDRDGKLNEKEFKEWGATSFEVTLLLEQFDLMDRKIESSSGISGPTDVQHTTHVAVTEGGGISIDNIPPSWIILFREAGVRRKELENPQTAMYLMETLADNLAKMKGKTQGSVPQAAAGLGHVPVNEQAAVVPAGAETIKPIATNVVTPTEATVDAQATTEASVETPAAVPTPPATPDVTDGPSHQAPPPPPPSAPTPPPAAATTGGKAGGKGGLLSEIQGGAKLHHVETNAEPPKASSANVLLDQIKAGTKLKKVEPADDDVAKLSAADRNDLTGVLARAIQSHRQALHEDEDGEEEADDWDDWE